MLDEAIQHDTEEDVKWEAAVAVTVILQVVNLVELQYGPGWKPMEEVRARVADIDRTRIIVMLKPLQQKLVDWANDVKAS